MVRHSREECGWKVGTRCGKKKSPIETESSPIETKVLSIEVSGPNEGNVDL